MHKYERYINQPHTLLLGIKNHHRGLSTKIYNAFNKHVRRKIRNIPAIDLDDIDRIISSLILFEPFEDIRDIRGIGDSCIGYLDQVRKYWLG